MKLHPPLAVMWLACAVGVAGPSSAETIRLKNGNEFSGTIERSDEQTVTVSVPDVGTLTLERSDIASIGPSTVDSAPAPPSPSPQVPRRDAPELALFRNPNRSVRLWYPKGWHVMESADQYPYLVTIEPTAPSPDLQAMAPTTIELFKYYHVSLTMNFGQTSARDVLDRFVKTLPTLGGGGTVLEQRSLIIQGVPAKLVTLQAKDRRSPTLLRMFVLAAVKDDVLATVFCQAPDTEFDSRRSLYEAVATRVEPFSIDADNADNARIDRESARLTNEALTLLKAGDGKGVAERFEHAVRINPGDAATRMNYGSVLFMAARDQSGDTRATLLNRSEQELQLSAKFFQTAWAPQDAAPLLSQVYFLLGEIAYFGRGDRARAKPLYEQSLRYYRHPGAAEALKRYGGT